MFVGKTNFLRIFVMIKEKFWKIDNLQNHKIKRTCLEFQKSVKLRSQVFIALSCVSASFFFLSRYITNRRQIGENLPFPTYVPSFVPFHILFLVEAIVGYQVMFSILAMDVVILTALTLAAIQFKMLSLELENMFVDSGTEGHNKVEMFRNRILRCNEHHNLLLE